jgi:pyruvate dehydrogenase E1 component beta subunit
LDDELVFDSVRKTGRLVVADTGWETCGVAAEVSARVASNVFGSLKAPIRRVCLPDSPTPTCPSLEKEFYPGAEDIAAAVRTVVGRVKEPVRPRGSARTQESWDKGFTGPF